MTIIESAFSTPTTRGRRWVPPAPGKSPSFTSGSPKRPRDGDPVVAGQRDLEPAAEGGAVDRGHHGLGAALDGSEHLVEDRAPRGGLPNSVMSAPAMKVRPSQTMTMAPRRRRRGQPKAVAQPQAHAVAERVDGRIVHGEDRDAAAPVEIDEGVMAVMSGSLSTLKLGSGMLSRPRGRVGRPAGLRQTLLKSHRGDPFPRPRGADPARRCGRDGGRSSSARLAQVQRTCARRRFRRRCRRRPSPSRSNSSARTVRGRLAAIGIAAMGPSTSIRLRRPTGRSHHTQAGWAGTDLAGMLGAGLRTPVASRPT